MTRPIPIPPNSSNKPRGEVYVWLCAVGLTIGLVMIVFLLGLILRNGISVFWPNDVQLIRFEEKGDTRFRNGLTVAGIPMMEKDISTESLTSEQLQSSNPEDRRERKLFIGNRDVYGQAFSYFNVGDIRDVTFPENIMNLERIEWGNALGFPIHLELEEGVVIPADSPEFKSNLFRIIEEVRERRHQINHLERKEIGKISSRISALETDRRYLEGKETLTPADEAELQRAMEELERLQAQYEPLAARAGELRRKNNAVTLLYRIPTGEELSLSLGDIVRAHFPNQMSILEKSRLFLVHIREFLIRFPREANTEGGIFPAIFGTFVMTLLMSVAVTPFGVLAAIYLREYAKQGPLVRAVRIAVNNLAGVPSIVFGVFGLGFFIYFVGDRIDHWFFPRAVESNTPVFGTGGILWASLTLALMTVPVVIVATEEALAAVSRGIREGSLACGASKWQTIQNLILPASLPGILTGLILAMARGAGEVAPLMLVGVVALAPNLPIDGEFPFFHLERKFMHLGFHIYDLGFQSPNSEAAIPMVFATTLVLILLVIILNLAAIILRNYLKKKYMANAF